MPVSKRNSRETLDERSISHRQRVISELSADPELALQYLLAAAEDDDPRLIASALKTVAAIARWR